MPAILKACASAGASFAGFVPLRLPWALAPMFEDWLEKHFPQRKAKVLGRIRQIRAGKLNDAGYYTRMTGEGPLAEHLAKMFEVSKRRAGIVGSFPELRRDQFRRPLAANEQLPLFSG